VLPSTYRTQFAAIEPLEARLAPLCEARFFLLDRLRLQRRVEFGLRAPLLHMAPLPVEPQRPLGGQGHVAGFALV